MGQIVGQMTGFKVFKGTKQEFINSGKNTTYKDAIVFITGGTDASASCIFAQDTYFASITDLLTTINYVKGINIDGKSYNVAAGGGYIGFEATNPAEVKVNATNNGIAIGLSDAFVKKVDDTATALGSSSDAANAGGSAFARIANLAALVSDLTGGSTESIEGQISSAINNLRTEIVGTLDTADAKTLAAINDELDALSANFNNYVTTAQLASLAGSGEGGVNVKVTVTSAGGEVKTVTVDETGLNAALALKANAADVYTKSEVDTLVGNAETAAKEHANGLNTAMDTRVKVLEAIDHEKLAADASAAAVATVLGGAPEKFDTLKEIAEWIAEENTAEDAAALVTRVSDLEANANNYVAADTALETSLKGYVDGKITEANGGANSAAAAAEAAAKAYADTLVKDEEGNARFDAAGAAEAVEGRINAKLEGYYTEAEADAKFVQAEGYVAYSEAEKAKLAGIAAGAQVNVIESIEVNGVTATINENKKASVTVDCYKKAEVDAMWNWEII
jgi:hypothetical protein